MSLQISSFSFGSHTFSVLRVALTMEGHLFARFWSHDHVAFVNIGVACEISHCRIIKIRITEDALYNSQTYHVVCIWVCQDVTMRIILFLNFMFLCRWAGTGDKDWGWWKVDTYTCPVPLLTGGLVHILLTSDWQFFVCNLTVILTCSQPITPNSTLVTNFKSEVCSYIYNGKWVLDEKLLMFRLNLSLIILVEIMAKISHS